jgi:hypothetical protein
MTNLASLKFDDDDINDEELLAACDEITSKTPDPIVPTGNGREEFRTMKYSFVFC